MVSPFSFPLSSHVEQRLYCEDSCQDDICWLADNNENEQHNQALL